MIKIAIDGFMGSGKGTLAKGLAKKFGLRHLDTGAIFRGIGCAFLDMGITELTEQIVKDNIENVNVSVVFEGDNQKVLLNNNDITHRLRLEESSKMSSKVSIYGDVREKYLEIVRKFANENDCIIDGRDITSIVLPDADVKIFLTADEKVRAERRYKENIEKNIACTFEEVLANLQERDYRDSHRDIAPLKIVEDAIVVDNTEIDINETIEKCIDIVSKVLKEKGKL